MYAPDIKVILIPPLLKLLQLKYIAEILPHTANNVIRLANKPITVISNITERVYNYRLIIIFKRMRVLSLFISLQYLHSALIRVLHQSFLYPCNKIWFTRKLNIKHLCRTPVVLLLYLDYYFILYTLF